MPNVGAPPFSSTFSARVVAVHGRTLRVRAGEQLLLASPARRDLTVVCGDQVQCVFDARHAQVHITAIGARRGTLYRTSARGAAELVAANVTLLVAVVAEPPDVDCFIIDRYLAAARCEGLTAAVVANKADRGLTSTVSAELSTLADLGYDCLTVSAHTSRGLPELRALLAAHLGLLVGQSGVGKSSLLRALAPDCDAAVGELIRGREGRHTTATARLYPLPGGGELIDSPGVRDFAPAIERLDAATLGFVEVERLRPQCRFTDCRHMQEPDCAVREAVGGGFAPRRYESYRRLRRLYERLQERARRR
jgi:ribosome biogenesis GTPase